MSEQFGQADHSDIRAPIVYKLGRMPCRFFTTVWLDLKVYGVKQVPLRGGVIIASNHQSNLDPVLIGVQLPRPLSFLGKAELFVNPYFGWLIRNLNAFPIHQGEGDIGAVKETIRRLHEGHALNMFPEGSRSEDGEIAALLPGIGLIIRRAEVPVVPAVVDGSFDAMPRGSTLIHSAAVRVMFGPPMELADLKAGQITQRIEMTLRSMLDELRRGDPELRAAHRRRRHGK